MLEVRHCPVCELEFRLERCPGCSRDSHAGSLHHVVTPSCEVPEELRRLAVSRTCETCLGCGKTGWAPTGVYHEGLGMYETNEVAITTLMDRYPENVRQDLWDAAGPCTSCDGTGKEPV